MSEVTEQTEDAGVACADPNETPLLSAADAIEAWDRALRVTSMLLRATDPDAAWLDQAIAASDHQHELAQRDPDTAIYLLMQAASGKIDRYSARDLRTTGQRRDRGRDPARRQGPHADRGRRASCRRRVHLRPVGRDTSQARHAVRLHHLRMLQAV